MISLLNTYKDYWFNSFNIKKAASRSDYQIAIIGNIVILLILWFLNNLFNPVTVRSPFGIRTSAQLYFLLLSIIPQISITIRRLKDINKKWDWIFLSVHPAGNLFTVIWLFFAKSGSKRTPFAAEKDIKRNKISKKRFFVYGLFIPFGALFYSVFELFFSLYLPFSLFFSFLISIFLLLPKAYNSTEFNKNKKWFHLFLFGALTLIYWFSLWSMIIIFGLMTLGSMLGDGSDSSSSAVKNVLVNGIKECVVNQVDNKPTTFKDVRTFSDGYTKLKNFDIKPIDPNTCFKAKAVPKTDQNTWFEIEMDENIGVVTKTCGDASKSGCKEGNTW